jgi:hypothetical protein
LRPAKPEKFTASCAGMSGDEERFNPTGTCFSDRSHRDTHRLLGHRSTKCKVAATRDLSLLAEVSFPHCVAKRFQLFLEHRETCAPWECGNPKHHKLRIRWHRVFDAKANAEHEPLFAQALYVALEKYIVSTKARKTQRITVARKNPERSTRRPPIKRHPSGP